MPLITVVAELTPNSHAAWFSPKARRIYVPTEKLKQRAVTDLMCSRRSVSIVGPAAEGERERPMHYLTHTSQNAFPDPSNTVITQCRQLHATRERFAMSLRLILDWRARRLLKLLSITRTHSMCFAGLPVRRDFWDGPPLFGKKVAIRQELGLPGQRRVVMVRAATTGAERQRRQASCSAIVQSHKVELVGESVNY